MSQFTQGHALLIGIGTYQHMADVDVPITVADARAIHAVLADENLCGYPPDQITLLHNEATTRTALFTALDNLAAATKPDSTVVLYYAGHGEYGTDGNYYLSTHDTQREGARIAKDTGLRDDELLTKLRAIPAKRLLLLFNACHSGAISPDLSIAPPPSLGVTPPPEETLDAILGTGEGRIIITACRPQQKSRVGHGQLTLFTQALVEGLRGQGYVANRSGYISAFGLYEHLYETVKASAADLGYQQDPELTVLRGVGPFPVALYRGATSLGLFDEQETLPPNTAVRTINPERSQRMLKRYQINTSGGAYITGNVNTGGGDFVGRDKITTTTTAFNQSGQTVLGPQTNIAGGVHTAGGIFNSGIMNSSPTSSQSLLLAQLRNLQTRLTQAAQQGLIDEDTAIDAESAIRKAINQADKPTPNQELIQTHLATARDQLAHVPAASGLVTALNAVIRLAI